jgi:hypothetical protein
MASGPELLTATNRERIRNRDYTSKCVAGSLTQKKPFQGVSHYKMSHTGPTSGSIELTKKPEDNLQVRHKAKMLERLSSTKRDFAGEILPGKQRFSVCSFQKELSDIRHSYNHR